MEEAIRTIKYHDTDEIKNSVDHYDAINEQIRTLQTQIKSLRGKKENINTKLKHFMKFNDIRTCHLSNVRVKKMEFIERTCKQPLTVSFIKQEMETFFDEVDFDEFRALTTKERIDLMFEYFEHKRTTKVSEMILIKK